MALIEDLNLIIDRQSKRLLTSFDSLAVTTLPTIFNQDQYNLKIRIVEPNTGSFNRPWRDVSDTYSVQVGIGQLKEAPTAGNWALSDTGTAQTSGTLTIGEWYLISDYNAGDDFANVGGANETGSYFQASGTTPTTWTNSSEIQEATAAVTFDVSAADLQTAVRTLANWGAATVTKNESTYRVNRVTAGTGFSLEAINISLQPTSQIAFSSVQTGTASIPQIDFFNLRQSPLARALSFSAFASATATITAVIVGGASSSATHRIALNDDSYDGVFILTYIVGASTQTSAAIPYNASAAVVQSTLEAMSNIGANNVTVTKNASGTPEWTIKFTGTLANTNIAAPTADVTGLSVPIGKQGLITLATDEMLSFLSESATGIETVVFEVELTPSSGKPVTIFQGDVTVSEDLIKGQLTAPAPRAQYATLDEISSLYLALLGGTMAGNINMNGNSITNAVIPTHLPLTGGTLSGDLNLGGNDLLNTLKIQNQANLDIISGVDASGKQAQLAAFKMEFGIDTLLFYRSTAAIGANPSWNNFFGFDPSLGLQLFGTVFYNYKREIRTETTTGTLVAEFSGSLILQRTAGIVTSLWATPTNGNQITIKNTSLGATTISGNGETIEGETAITLFAGESIDLIYSTIEGEWLVI